MRATILGLAAGLILLTGCAAQAQQLAKVCVQDDPEYQQYLQWQAAELLDSDGYYQTAELANLQQQADTQVDGSLEVSFGENNKLSISYYYDAAMTQPIDTYNCWLNPGDSIYAAAAVSQEHNTDLYALDHYRIYAYDDAGQLLGSYETGSHTEGLIYQIPADFLGSSLSVMPVGAYAAHSLTTEAYYTDADGSKQVLSNAGIWYMDDQAVSSNGIQVDATQPYQLEYHLDTEHYFFVRSTPEPFYASDGIVMFPQTHPTESLSTYTVELHPYLTLSLQCEQEAVVQWGEQPKQTVKKGKTKTLDQLQYGDTILVETAGTCTIVDGDYPHIAAASDLLPNGKTRYTLTVQEQRSGRDAAELLQTIQVHRVFTVTLNPEGKFGTCVYTLDGTTVSGTVEIREGQKLEVTYTLTDRGYELADLGWWDGLWNDREQTVELAVDAEMDGQTICGEDWIDVQEKG